METTGRAWKAGEVLDERYRIVGVVGQGAMGIVYEATDINLGDRRVAIKTILPGAAAGDAESLYREAERAAKLDAENIVAVLDRFTFEGAPYMVMEYLEGETLLARLQKEKTLEIAELRQILLPVFHAIHSAHSQSSPLIHRDLKPDNIFLKEGHS